MHLQFRYGQLILCSKSCYEKLIYIWIYPKVFCYGQTYFTALLKQLTVNVTEQHSLFKCFLILWFSEQNSRDLAIIDTSNGHLAYVGPGSVVCQSGWPSGVPELRNELENARGVGTYWRSPEIRGVYGARNRWAQCHSECVLWRNTGSEWACGCERRIPCGGNVTVRPNQSSLSNLSPVLFVQR